MYYAVDIREQDTGNSVSCILETYDDVKAWKVCNQWNDANDDNNFYADVFVIEETLKPWEYGIIC